MVAAAPDWVQVIDTAPLHLDQIIDHMASAHENGQDVARVHSGDPSIYGAVAEQMRRLDALGIDYDVTPGVPAFAAAAAALKRELTLPGISQTIIVTRTEGKASPMPDGEDLASLAKAGATLALHLSVRNLAKVVRELSPEYGEDCPVVVIYRATWPDEKIIHGRLKDIREKVRAEKITRTALVLVGQVFGDTGFGESKLYHADHRHILRPK
jgi:precorrin-4/cobalt-precorrin-4 C11-methyltransferase